MRRVGKDPGVFSSAHPFPQTSRVPLELSEIGPREERSFGSSKPMVLGERTVAEKRRRKMAEEEEWRGRRKATFRRFRSTSLSSDARSDRLFTNPRAFSHARTVSSRCIPAREETSANVCAAGVASGGGGKNRLGAVCLLLIYPRHSLFRYYGLSTSFPRRRLSYTFRG